MGVHLDGDADPRFAGTGGFRFGFPLRGASRGTLEVLLEPRIGLGRGAFLDVYPIVPTIVMETLPDSSASTTRFLSSVELGASW